MWSAASLPATLVSVAGMLLILLWEKVTAPPLDAAAQAFLIVTVVLTFFCIPSVLLATAVGSFVASWLEESDRSPTLIVIAIIAASCAPPLLYWLLSDPSKFDTFVFVPVASSSGVLLSGFAVSSSPIRQWQTGRYARASAK
jgi:hypothetical protein